MMRPLVLACLSVSCAFAQPPDLIRVVRQGNIGPYIATQAPANVLGMSAISGPAENWLIEMHDSFASLEAVDKVLSTASPLTTKDAAPFPDLLADSQTLIASYRFNLSHRADEAIQMFPKMRYLDLAIIRIPVGTDGDLSKLLRLRSVRLGRSNADRPEIVYEVVSGAPAGIYLVLAPMTSLATLDNGRVNTLIYAEGGDQEAMKIVAATEIVWEHVWMRVEPRGSYVSDEFATEDLNFWRP
jgi:hypothetical protein